MPQFVGAEMHPIILFTPTETSNCSCDVVCLYEPAIRQVRSPRRQRREDISKSKDKRGTERPRPFFEWAATRRPADATIF